MSKFGSVVFFVKECGISVGQIYIKNPDNNTWYPWDVIPTNWSNSEAGCCEFILEHPTFGTIDGERKESDVGGTVNFWGVQISAQWETDENEDPTNRLLISVFQ